MEWKVTPKINSKWASYSKASKISSNNIHFHWKKKQMSVTEQAAFPL